METVQNIEKGAFISTATLGRFIPEPRSRAGISFKGALNAAGALLSTAAPSFPGLDIGYQDLLNKQIEVQQQMQLVSLYSNIEKSKHETQMAAVRNIRVG